MFFNGFTIFTDLENSAVNQGIGVNGLTQMLKIISYLDSA